MRHLRVLNLVFSHRNTRFFYQNVASYHISAQIFLCVCGARMKNVSACVVRAHVTLSALACARHDLRTCILNEM